MLRVIEHGREVYEILDDGSEGDHIGGSDCSFLECEWPDVDGINSHLWGYGMPALEEWQPVFDIPGWYCIRVNEDGDGYVGPHGKYMADYTIEVQKLAVEPFVLEESDERVS